MTNGERHTEAPDTVLRRVAGRLAPRTLSRMIDLPVDTALAEFRFTWLDEQSTRGMLQHSARLLELIQSHFTPSGASVLLEPECIKDEAYHALDQGYESDHGRGFSAAVFEMVATPRVLRPGIDTVLIRLGEAIKTRLRQRWTDYVLSSELSSRPFAERRRIASLILDRWSRDLPPEIARGPTAKWAGELPGLVVLLMDNLAVRDTIFGADEDAATEATARESPRPAGFRLGWSATTSSSRHSASMSHEGSV